ncbi:hypothetical protein [Janibacter cremeus]|uniref:Uncharacterized protein n=1 Tax=Janibacter cremeus TaxID=1285192 RepID=A0A852VIF7_9MICO|nr:hypothetical protein [Janibacter cremeus]NYF96852.1 hypothetical protein [Janibacter cremeus]
MTAEPGTQPSGGVPRRTVARTAAWSVPVVTTALAAPTLAASTSETVDLDLQGHQSGSVIPAYSPDRLQMYELSMTSGFDAVNVGAAPVPTGTIVTLSFDSRMMGESTVNADGAALESAGTRTDGNATVASFLLPVEIPAGGMVSLDPDFTFADPLPWATNIEPYTVTISPPAGIEDANPGNNSSSSAARYHDTVDAVLSATWREHTLFTAEGDPLPLNVQDTVTITANSPGDVPSGGGLYFSAGTVYDGSAYTYDVYDELRIVSATLDGQDVLDSIIDETSSDPQDSYSWRVNVAIAGGQQLVVGVEADVSTRTREYVYSGPSVSFSTSRDRDDTNNRASAGPTP